MIPVLKLKDASTGTWKDVVAIKGEDGKDGKNYAITENDYDAIAEVVLTKLVSAESVSV